MRTLILESPSHPKSLKLIEAPLPEPKTGEVRVKFSAMGLNRADLLFCQGRYFIKPEAGSRLGFEGAGLIDKLGPDTEKFSLGDCVALCPMSFDVHTQGCFSDYGIYSQEALILCPKEIDSQINAAIWMAYLTAWGGLVMAGNLSKGETVVVTAASNAVGIAAIQIANMLGAKVIATTTSESKAESLLTLGAQQVFIQNQSTLEDSIYSYVKLVNDSTQGMGSDLVFDAVAGPMTHALVKASKREGRIIIQGMLDRKPMDIHAGVLMKRLLTLKGYTVDLLLSKPEQKKRAIDGILRGLEQNKINPIIARTFELDEFEHAFDYLKANSHVGKVIITT